MRRHFFLLIPALLLMSCADEPSTCTLLFRARVDAVDARGAATSIEEDVCSETAEEQLERLRDLSVDGEVLVVYWRGASEGSFHWGYPGSAYAADTSAAPTPAP